jgi:hypothetical protein
VNDPEHHPCPLLEGRRGTVTTGCVKSRDALFISDGHVFLLNAAARHGSPPSFKEGTGVVLHWKDTYISLSNTSESI